MKKHASNSHGNICNSSEIICNPFSKYSYVTSSWRAEGPGTKLQPHFSKTLITLLSIGISYIDKPNHCRKLRDCFKPRPLYFPLLKWLITSFSSSFEWSFFRSISFFLKYVPFPWFPFFYNKNKPFCNFIVSSKIKSF